MKYTANVHQEYIIPVTVQAESPEEALERIHDQLCETGDQYPGDYRVTDLQPHET